MSNLTEEQIRLLIKEWPDKSYKELAEMLGVSKHKLQFVVSQIRKMKPDVLPKKTLAGTGQTEVIKKVLENL